MMMMMVMMMMMMMMMMMLLMMISLYQMMMMMMMMRLLLSSTYIPHVHLYRWQFLLSLVGCIIIHALHAFCVPPPHLPDLIVVLSCFYSAAHFGAFWLYFHSKQAILPVEDDGKAKTD